MSSSWDKKFLKLALEIASWSKDKSTKVGSVLVRNNSIITTGYNGFPRRINDSITERHERPDKYMWTEHSERNCLYQAARIGTPTEGSTIYINSFPEKLLPCADCARAIIQSGIVRIVQEPMIETVTRWSESTDTALQMFSEAGIIQHTVSL